MRSKGMKLGAVLMAMLLLSMAFVPAVSAQTDAENIKKIAEHNDKQINGKEKDAINNLTNQPNRIMKVSASVRRICSSCKIIKRHGKVFVICSRDPRHKQRQG